MVTIKAAIGMLAVIGGFILVGAAAEAQTEDDGGGQYVPGGPVFGDLVVDGPATFGQGVTLAGEGFGPGAVVQLDIRDNVTGDVVSTTENTADGAGTASVEVALDDPIGPGRYTATLSGQSPDGATVELSTGLVVETEAQQEAELGLTDDDGPLGAGERNANGFDDEGNELAAVDSGGGSNFILFGLIAIAVVVLGAGAAFVVARRSRPTY